MNRIYIETVKRGRKYTCAYAYTYVYTVHLPGFCTCRLEECKNLYGVSFLQVDTIEVDGVVEVCEFEKGHLTVGVQKVTRVEKCSSSGRAGRKELFLNPVNLYALYAHASPDL